MPICEECKFETPRRVTFRRANTCKKVCKACEERLSYEDFSLLCNIIMDPKSICKQ